MPQLAKQLETDPAGVVARIERGDPAAEADLVARYERGVRLILLKRTGDPHLVADLVQETFMVVLRKLRAQELRNESALSAFISKVAVNISIEHFRKEARFVHSPDGIIEPSEPHIERYDERADFETARAELRGVLDQLAITRDREILRRFYLSDDDKDAICEDLELSPAHFDRVLYRAKQRMRELIDRQAGLKALLFGGLLDD